MTFPRRLRGRTNETLAVGLERLDGRDMGSYEPTHLHTASLP